MCAHMSSQNRVLLSCLYAKPFELATELIFYYCTTPSCHIDPFNFYSGAAALSASMTLLCCFQPQLPFCSGNPHFCLMTGQTLRCKVFHNSSWSYWAGYRGIHNVITQVYKLSLAFVGPGAGRNNSRMPNEALEQYWLVLHHTQQVIALHSKAFPSCQIYPNHPVHANLHTHTHICHGVCMYRYSPRKPRRT